MSTKIPDWLFLAGFAVISLAGITALVDQTKTLLRKIRARQSEGKPND